MCASIFSTIFFSVTFLILTRIQQDMIINLHMSSCSVPRYSCHILINLEFSRQINQYQISWKAIQ